MQMYKICLLVIIFAFTPMTAVIAADPGDACTSTQADSWQVSDTDSYKIYCDGTQWRLYRQVDTSGATTSRIKQTVTFGPDSASCDSDVEGTVRYNSTSNCLEYCDGTDWTSMNCP